MAKKQVESTIRTPILIALLILVVYLLVLGPLGFFDRAKLKTQDTFTRLNVLLKPAPPIGSNIVFLTIDDQSFKAMGKRWPWGRDMFATFLEKIGPSAPKLVCFDIAFYGESANKSDDIKFAQAIKKSGNVILPSYIGESSGYLLPLSMLRQYTVGVGFLNKPKDVDSVIRDARITFSSATGEHIGYSLETQIAISFLGIPFRDFNIPLRRDGTIPIKFTTRYKEFKSIPIWHVFKDRIKKEELKDKIILIGATSESFHDIHVTPLGSMPGLGILGNCMVMLLGKDYLKEVPGIVNFILIIFLCLFTMLATYKLSIIKGLIFVILELAVFIGASILLFWRNWQLDFFSPIFVIIIGYLLVNIYKYVNLIIESVTLRRLALTDELTGLFAFRYFQVKFQSEFDKAVQAGHDLSLLIIDIDHFKTFNDTYGHEQGNIVLKAAAKLIQASCRKLDIAARYGGEEFCVILPLTGDKGAIECGERLRKMVEEYAFPGQEKALKVTVSVGAASLHNTKAQNATELIKCADSGLYKAKNSGRNKTCLFK